MRNKWFGHQGSKRDHSFSSHFSSMPWTFLFALFAVCMFMPVCVHVEDTDEYKHLPQPFSALKFFFNKNLCVSKYSRLWRHLSNCFHHTWSLTELVAYLFGYPGWPVSTVYLSLPTATTDMCLYDQLLMQVLGDVNSGLHTYRASVLPTKLSAQSPSSELYEGRASLMALQVKAQHQA